MGSAANTRCHMLKAFTEANGAAPFTPTTTFHNLSRLCEYRNGITRIACVSIPAEKARNTSLKEPSFVERHNSSTGKKMMAWIFIFSASTKQHTARAG